MKTLIAVVLTLYALLLLARLIAALIPLGFILYNIVTASLT